MSVSLFLSSLFPPSLCLSIQSTNQGSFNVSAPGAIIHQGRTAPQQRVATHGTHRPCEQAFSRKKVFEDDSRFQEKFQEHGVLPIAIIYHTCSRSCKFEPTEGFFFIETHVDKKPRVLSM